MIAPLLAVIALGAVALLVAAGVLYIWNWGPGTVTRHVTCPERHISARVTFIQREGQFAHLEVADVTQCSLLGAGPVTCSKACRL